MGRDIFKGSNSILFTNNVLVVLQMKDSDLVTLELLKHVVFKVECGGFSAFFPKQELGESGLLGRSFLARSKWCNDYRSFSGSGSPRDVSVVLFIER